MEWYFLIVGLIVFGEAFALYIGVFRVKNGSISWNTSRNRFYLITDSVAGVFLLAGYFISAYTWFQYLAILPAVGLIFTHYKRTTEFLLRKPEPFCANKALFAVNNLKLVLLFGLLFIVLPF